MIDESNLIKVLRSAYTTHQQNMREIDYLFNYELGDQPLPREKKIRADINVVVSENAANYVTDFKKGYFTGSLKPEEYHDYGPVELFCSSFRKNWKQALDIIAEERKSL